MRRVGLFASHRKKREVHDRENQEELTSTDATDLYVIEDAQAVEGDMKDSETLESRKVIAMRTISRKNGAKHTHFYVMQPLDAFDLIVDLAEVLFNDEGVAEFKRIFGVE